MNYLISGLAKSRTTILFSRFQEALPDGVSTFFEPDQDNALREILDLGRQGNTLTKVLVGRVKAENTPLRDFDRHVLIYRDPRDQFISMLLYLFYDFQLNGDAAGYRSALQALEAVHGRVRSAVRWSPRTLDLDLLLYGTLELGDQRLTIPHPELTRRPFVLFPLHEIAPDVVVPGRGSVADLVSGLSDAGLTIVEQGT